MRPYTGARRKLVVVFDATSGVARGSDELDGARMVELLGTTPAILLTRYFNPLTSKRVQ